VLREFRKKAKLSQENLAFEADLDRAFIGRLERGISQPSIETLFALARAMKVRPSAIVAAMER
jgi:transcriptional regulator with XRE-family HTH domain